MGVPKIPANWEKWCTTGRHGIGARKKNAVIKCLSNGTVRGYFSDIPLNPDLDPTHSMYPSFEHLSDPENHAEAVFPNCPLRPSRTAYFPFVSLLYAKDHIS